MLIQRNEASKNGLPDLDEFFKKLTPSFRKSAKDPFGAKKHNLHWWALCLFLLLAVLVGFSSIITVKPGEALVVTRFGAYVKTLQPGTRFTLPFIEERTLVDLNQTYTVSLQTQNLTDDNNLVKVSVNLAYKINNPQLYLFSGSVHSAIQASLSQASTVTILKSNFADLLDTANWKVIANTISGNLGDLSTYGVTITGVEVQQIQVPDSLSQDFDSAISGAQSQVQSIMLDAHKFSDSLAPLAAQKAAASISFAEAEKFATMVNATRDAAEVSSLIPAYQQDGSASLSYLPLLMNNNWRSLQAITALDTNRGSGDASSQDQSAYLRWKRATSEEGQAEDAQ